MRYDNNLINNPLFMKQIIGAIFLIAAVFLNMTSKYNYT